MKYHNGRITKKSNDGRHIFVFGSNLAGRHGAGAALYARHNWGAVYGVGSGATGYAYAIPTKDEKLRVRPIHLICEDVQQFLRYAGEHPKLEFLVTRIGCMLAGYKDEQIAGLFKTTFSNVYLPPEWIEFNEYDEPRWFQLGEAEQDQRFIKLVKELSD